MDNEYLEYLVEYDLQNLVVYVSGLTKDSYWEEFNCFDDVNDPESFALGLVEGYKANGKFASVTPVFIDGD